MEMIKQLNARAAFLLGECRQADWNGGRVDHKGRSGCGDEEISAPTGNWTPIHRSSIPYPAHYTDLTFHRHHRLTLG
jgi:hypothetical protein